MFKADPGGPGSFVGLAPPAMGAGNRRAGSIGSQVQLQRWAVVLSLLLFVLLAVRQVVYDSVARLSLEEAAELRGRVTGKVFVEGEPVSLAVVYPFYAGDIGRVETNLAGWGGPGNRAHKACSPKYARHTTLVFYFNFDIADAPNKNFERRLVAATKPVSRCFRRVQFESAKLTAEEDKYPIGVSIMFYRILLSESFARRFDYMFWMESDVQVIRPLWLDNVYQEAMFPGHFWVKGSMYRGDQWDGIPEDHPMQWEIMQPYAYHINGVGLYRLGDADFEQFVRHAMKKWPPTSTTSMNPFDISIWKALQEVVSPAAGELATTDNWRIFQRYGHCVLYTNFVWNLGGNVGQEVLSRARRSKSTFLIHGGSENFKSRAAAQQLSEESSRRSEEEATRKAVAAASKRRRSGDSSSQAGQRARRGPEK